MNRLTPTVIGIILAGSAAMPASAIGLEAIYKGTAVTTVMGPNGSSTSTGAFEADFYYDTTLGTVSPDGSSFVGLPENESAEFNGYFLGSENSFSTSNVISGDLTTITHSISGLDGNLTVNLTADTGLIPGNVQIPFATVTGFGTGSFYSTLIDGPNVIVSASLDTTSVEVLDLSPPSTVPLPASAPLFGAALMALGAVGYGLKHKKAAAA